jgi:hypothetical protein
MSNSKVYVSYVSTEAVYAILVGGRADVHILRLGESRDAVGDRAAEAVLR